MKKTLLKAFGVLALAATMLMASCSTDASNISSQIDTVLTLSAPEVKVTAYPGMNYVSWKPVANANGYLVYIYEDGHFVDTVSKSYSDLEHEDNWRLKNGAEYTYYVEATSKSSTGRSVITENSLSKPVSVKAIVPDYNVKALDLNNHEKGIGKKGNDKFVVNADNIHIARDSYDKLSVSFPSKAYLGYNVYWTIDNELASVNGKRAILDKWSTSVPKDLKYYGDSATNDKILVSGEDTVITTSGTYKFGVLAFSKNDHFGASDIVWATETIEIENLVGKFGDTYAVTKAEYKDLGKTVRVVFPKFVLEDGTTAPASYYKVYRSPKDAPYNYTPVSGTVKATDSTNSVFYVEDTVEDNTVAYYYTLVVTDGKKFAGNAPDPELVKVYTPAQATILATTVAGAPSIQETDGIANDITWTFKLAADTKVKGIYTLERPVTEAYNNGTYQVVAADFDTSDEKNLIASLKSTTNTDGVTYTVYTKNHTVGTNVYMLVVIEEEDKSIREVISAAVKIEAPVASDNDLDIFARVYDNTINGANVSTTVTKDNDIIINVIDEINENIDALANYTYKLYRANVKTIATSPFITWEFDAADWVEIEGFVMKPAASDGYNNNTYIGIIEQTDVADGTYAYKVVKTNNYGSSVSALTYKTINTKKTIAYTPGANLQFPGVRAKFAEEDKATSNIDVEFIKGWGNLTRDETGASTTENAIYGEAGTLLAGEIKGYKPLANEEGVTYTLYRATLGNYDGTSAPEPGDNYAFKLQFAKVMDGASPKAFAPNIEQLYDYTIAYIDTSVSPNVVDYQYDAKFNDKITYKLQDSSLSTSDSYMYIVVATLKVGDEIIDTVMSDPVIVKGNN